MANYNTVTFVTKTARRIADPNFKDEHGIERHLFAVPVRELPKGIGFDPNARDPNLNKRVYREVSDSLFNRNCEPGTFHLKNKGITIIASQVKQNPREKDKYEVSMLNGTHGIVDGGHTYELITKAQGDPDLPEDQYVNVEVRVGVPDPWITDIAGGLNTSIQVQRKSLADLGGAFDWIKKELRGEPYCNEIAWSENDSGAFDALDLVALMTMFNVKIYPNDEDTHPVSAFARKADVALKDYEKKQKSFEDMCGILKDILRFHDIVRKEYHEIWNKDGGSAGSLSFSEKPRRKRDKNCKFLFTGEKAEYQMANGALYPILAAFRWYVECDKYTDKMFWRGGFPAVKNAWKDCSFPLLKATHEMSKSLGYNINSLKKNRPHWSNLHNIVAKHDLQRRASGQ